MSRWYPCHTSERETGAAVAMSKIIDMAEDHQHRLERRLPHAGRDNMEKCDGRTEIMAHEAEVDPWSAETI